MVIRDRRQAKRVRYAPAVSLAVPGKGEHRLQQPLEPQGRSNLAEKPGADVARIPKRVCRAGRNEHGLTSRCDQPLMAETESDHPIEHPESLGLTRMHVCDGGAAPGSRVTSTITASPFESADVCWNVTVSPVKGFSMRSPVRIIRVSLDECSELESKLGPCVFRWEPRWVSWQVPPRRSDTRSSTTGTLIRTVVTPRTFEVHEPRRS